MDESRSIILSAVAPSYMVSEGSAPPPGEDALLEASMSDAGGPMEMLSEQQDGWEEQEPQM